MANNEIGALRLVAEGPAHIIQKTKAELERAGVRVSVTAAGPDLMGEILDVTGSVVRVSAECKCSGTYSLITGIPRGAKLRAEVVGGKPTDGHFVDIVTKVPYRCPLSPLDRITISHAGGGAASGIVTGVSIAGGGAVDFHWLVRLERL